MTDARERLEALWAADDRAEEAQQIRDAWASEEAEREEEDA